MKRLGFGIGLALQAAFVAHAQTAPEATQQAAPGEAAPGDAIFPTLTLASEYRYDGASNSSGEPVAQASLYWWRPDHFFAGAFLTTVDYSGFYDPDTSYEIDIYAGYNFDFGQPYFEMPGDATRLQLRAMYTAFPDQGPPGPTYNFLQLQAALINRTGPLTLRTELAYVPEASYGGGPSWKSEAGAGYALAPWLSLSGEYGYRENDIAADRSWWDIGATLNFGQIDLDLRYYDTDLDYAECGFSTNCDGGFVAALSWNPWKG